MKQSLLFTKTKKNVPSDEVSVNAQLLIRSGFIHKDMAGVYSFLPLGLLSLNKIIGIIREEMNAIGGQEVFLTSLQDKEPWIKTGRWDDAVVDNWFKTQLNNGTELGLGFTHEEPIVVAMKEAILTKKELPQYVYQIQTKFRNEKRAKSGILRSREFLMKDLYSFTKNAAELDDFYEKAKQAYINIFSRCGIGEQTYVTFASGGTFSKYSHEFQTICDAGEDIIYVDESKKIAVNKEVYTDDILAELGLIKHELVEKKAIEVGNIFKQMTKFSEPLDLVFTDEDGQKKPVIMGAYGIGPARVLGTVVEIHHDDAGIVWPKEIAPFDVHLLLISDAADHIAIAHQLYADLCKKGVSVLFDDRLDVRAGQKFADSDLIGIPTRLVLSQKTLDQGSVEVKLRADNNSSIISLEACLTQLTT